MEVRTEAELARVLAKEKRVAALFYATWCPFCRAFLPVFRAAELEGWSRLEVVIDEDDNPLWEKYSINIVPTVLFFENGKISLRLDGRAGRGLSGEELEATIEKLKGKA
ncbi:MAG: thioredoxin family protein [Candidatus Micrarchaeia archaeon]